MRNQGRVITSWNTPVLSIPTAVETARAAFDHAALDWAATKDEIKEAERAVIEAEAADIRAEADAYAEGREVAEPGARRRVAAAKVAPLAARLQVLELATDTAGDALSVAIAEARANWLADLASLEAEAAERYDAALAEARATLTELGLARSTAAWLQTFDVGLASVGMQMQFHGKPRNRVIGDRYGALSGEHDPAHLLTIAAGITAQASVGAKAKAAVSS